MQTSLQGFLAGATEKAAADLEAAVLRIPEDKRGWNPTDTARSALNMAAECAILNGSTATLIKTQHLAPISILRNTSGGVTNWRRIGPQSKPCWTRTPRK